MESSRVFGQPSFEIASDRVEATITELGGQLAPVRFHLELGVIEPFSIAPWVEDDIELPPILKVLRGDFFCLPFGGNEASFRGENYPIHGETANEKWKLSSHSDTSLTLDLDLLIRPGHVTKQVWVVPGQTALYQRHTISTMAGPMCLGHHAMLRFRSQGLVSTSPFGFGQVFPGEFEKPAEGGYTSLKPGARFDDLSQVPKQDGTLADLSRYPAREGFEDLVMVYAPIDATFGWTAVHFPEEGFIWFSLKDPRVLSGTVMWHSNGGRHYAPWSGRHRAVLGLEEVTSSFHWGLAGSVADSDAGKAGFKTYLDLDPNSPLVVNVIMGVVESGILEGAIARIEKIAGGIRLFDAHGRTSDVKVDVEQLYS